MARSLRSKRRLRNTRRKKEAIEPWKKAEVAKNHEDLIKHVSLQNGRTLKNKPSIPLSTIAKSNVKYKVTIDMDVDTTNIPVKLDKKITREKKMNEIKQKKEILLMKNKEKRVSKNK